MPVAAVCSPGKAVRLLSVGGLLAATELLSGCTVPADGFAGVTVDSHGVLEGVVQTCRHSVDGATLYPADNPNAPNTGKWEFTRSTAGHAVSWPLGAGPADGARATQSVAPMAPGTTYALYGWTHDSSWSAATVSFTLRDVTTLRPGRVLMLDAGSDQREVSLQQFADLACADSR